jgi:molecular chaperone DnaJ
MRDPYEVLGLDRTATEADIKAAFRKLAARHHPDRNPDDPGAQERFKEVNQAHQILSDPQKRAAFDRYGASAFNAGAAGPANVGFVDFAGFDGIFGDILGAFGIRGGDRGHIKTQLRITFEEAALGCEKEVTYERVVVCDRCRGATSEPGTTANTCPSCAGRGRVRTQHGLFPLPVEQFCGRCHGTGRVAATPCRGCKGRGRRQEAHRITVEIPAGIEAGASKVVERAGSVVRQDRPPGDLEVVVDVGAHPVFRRTGDDIVCPLSLSFARAALGAEVEVPTLEGPARLKVPPGTQTGQLLRLKNKGVPHRMRPGRGDQLVEVRVAVPTALSERARTLIRELGNELGEEVGTDEPGLMDRLKGWFG